ncbi:MAG: nicotinate-nucleotide--dimethylbenzimidazole phosphoribosyltransferase, partial [Caulobacteraceae bacterium]|nr:nicotinate-nucleotide--dimethylbenzimidazole phosphoribosyltransferase [Caulobacteraceae bacterium]
MQGRAALAFRTEAAIPRRMSSPFDDIRALIGQSATQGPAAAERDGPLLAAGWIGAWRGKAKVMRPILSLYAGAHAGGDAAATRAVLEAIAAGEAPVARGASHLGAGLDVYDLALDQPLPSAEAGPTMSERECAATMAFGMEVLAKQPDLLAPVGIGPGADEAARALLAALGSGGDPLELLRRWGGRETAAVLGAIVGARSQSIPVLLDGLPALAAACVLAAVDPAAVAHCRLAGSAPT